MEVERAGSEADRHVLAALPLRATPTARPLNRLAALRLLWFQGLLGALALAVLAAGIATALDVQARSPHLGLLATSGGRVLLVDPDGVAARAGIVAGDTVSAVGGLPVAGGGFSALAHTPGDTISIMEGGPGRFALFTTRVAAPSTTELAGDVAALVAALALWISGVLAGLPRRRDSAARLYAFAALALALAVCALVERDGSAFWPWPVLAPAALAGLAGLLLAAIAPALSRPWSAAVVAGVAVVGGPAAAAAVLGAFIPLPGFVAVWVAVALALLAVATMAGPLLVHAYTRLEPRRRHLRVTLLAGLLGLFPLCLWPGLNALAALAGRVTALSGTPIHVSPLWSVLGLVPMAALHAALAHSRDARLLDAYVQVGLSYVIPLALCAGAFLALIPALPAADLVATTAATVALFPLMQQGVGALLRRAAWQPAPDYAATLGLIEDLATTAATPAALAAAAVTRLPSLLRVRSASLVVQGLDGPADRYVVLTACSSSRGVERDELLPTELPEYGAGVPALPVATALGNGPAGMEPPSVPHPMAPRVLRLSPRVARALGHVDVALWAPLWWDGAQHGALALGPCLSGEPFSGDDLRQVAGLTGVLALALYTLDLISGLRERTTALAALTHRLSHAHEQERAHLSRELHDVVAQELIALTRQLRRYGATLETTPPPAIWADMLAAAQDALTATRRICNGLRPAILDLGLVPALRDLVTEAAERGDTTVSLSVSGAEQRLAGDLEFALFRVAQEGLTNALTHAQARQARVEVVFDGGVWLRVRDDGRGFVVPPRFEDLPGDHLGLIGMRERLDEFNGTVRVTSAPGHGTVLEAHVTSPM